MQYRLELGKFPSYPEGIKAVEKDDTDNRCSFQQNRKCFDRTLRACRLRL